MNFRLTKISSLQLFQLFRYTTYILIGVVFTKTSLSVQEIGKYEQFLFLSGAVSFFWLNGLVRGMLSLSKKEDRDPSSVIFNSFLLITTFTLLTILFLYVLNGISVKESITELQISYLYLMLAYLFFSIPANLIEYFFLLKDRAGKIVQFGMLNFFILFLAVALPSIFGKPILYSLYGLLISAFLRYVYLLFLFLKQGTLRISIPFIKEHLLLSVPLIVSALLSGSAQYVDGFIITSRFNEATFAIFRFGARELPLVLLLANALSFGLLPEFSGQDVVPDLLKKIKHETGKLAKVLFPVTAVLLMVSHFLFPIVFNAGFKESATVFNIYLLLITSRLLFPQTLLTGFKKTTVIAWASFFELVVNVSLSVWFVVLWGIQGVAYATVIAYLFEKIYLMIMVERRLNIRVTNYQNIFSHLIYSLFLFVLFYLVEFVIY